MKMNRVDFNHKQKGKNLGRDERMSVYPFSASLMSGEEVELSDYKGKVMLIVNTATKCGFSPQLKELEKLYERYKERGFIVLAFPSNQFMNQEPGSNKEVAERCALNFKLSFPLFKKVNVKGPDIHPLYEYLTKIKRGLFTSTIKWNFTKFLIDEAGQVVKRYAPLTPPKNTEEKIVRLLDEKERMK